MGVLLVNTPLEFYNYCLTHPTYDGLSWDQRCVSLVFRAGRFTTSAPSAWYAYQATLGYGNKVYTEAELPVSKIPQGWFPYWDIAGPDNGHIGMSTGGDAMLCATSRVTPMTSAHQALGSMGISEYTRRTGATYLGASPFFINATLQTTGTASTTTPFMEEEEETMRLMLVSGSNYYTLVTGGGWVDLPKDTAGDPFKDLKEAARKITGGAANVTAWSKAEETAFKTFYPKLGSAASPQIDYVKLAAALPKSPTVAEIATAVNSDAAKRLSA